MRSDIGCIAPAHAATVPPAWLRRKNGHLEEGVIVEIQPMEALGDFLWRDHDECLGFAFVGL
jgi:hypothetical protein